MHECVCQLKIGGKGVVERESAPKSVGGTHKRWGRPPFWIHILSWALRWAFAHLPLILALDFDMWPLSPLSLALVLAFEPEFLSFEGISYPF